jgi:predicted amidophosphoribosyltransferase
MDPLIHSLKGCGHDRIFSQLIPYLKVHKVGDVIHYPSRGSRDHASELATCFTAYYGGQAQALLKKTDIKQALLRKKERHQRAFIPSSSQPKQAYMIDDIVTSGGTALGCWKALGQPRKMTVWSLFYRKNL